MTKNQSPFDRPIPSDAICAFCGRDDSPLHHTCLSGTGDYPRRPILCEKCIARMRANASANNRTPNNPSMSETEMQRETRKQKALNRLGTDEPKCVCCGETDWRCMELHHLAGKDFEEFLIRVCRNCHRKLSDAQKDHPPKFGESPTTNESIGHFLQGLADLLIRIAEKLWEFGLYLIEQAALQTPKRKQAKS